MAAAVEDSQILTEDESCAHPISRSAAAVFMTLLNPRAGGGQFRRGTSKTSEVGAEPFGQGASRAIVGSGIAPGIAGTEHLCRNIRHYLRHFKAEHGVGPDRRRPQRSRERGAHHGAR